MSPSNNNRNVNGVVNGCNYIEHRVTNMDTLAGIAIKYGVELADIKRMNGLATDLQMFALKTLRIPLPGKHPPSANLPNGSTTSRDNKPDDALPWLGHCSLLESFSTPRLKSSQKKVSPAMNSLQSYYGIKSPNCKGLTECVEMTVLKKENGAVADATLIEVLDGDADQWSEKSIYRPQKAEADSGAGTPERLLKEENSGGSSGFSAIAGKSVALRTKAASRASLAADAESSPLSFGDSVTADETTGVHKSSSTSSLQDPDGSNSSIIRPAFKWSLKPDLQAFSASSITKPLLEGLPIPISGRKNKAALD